MDLFYLMKHDSIKKKNPLLIHSAPRLPSIEVEEKEEEIEEEETEGIQLQKTNPFTIRNNQNT